MLSLFWVCINGDRRMNLPGTAGRTLPAILVATALLLSAIACGPEPTATPTPTPEETVDDVLSSAVGRLLALQTARFQMIDEQESGAKFFGLTVKTVEGETQSPDRARILVNAVSPGFGFVEVEIVAAGEAAFMKFSKDAPWAPLPLDQVPFNFGGMGVTLSEIVQVIENPVLTGRESVGGAQTIRVDGDVLSEDLSNLITSVDPGHPIVLTLWIDEGSRELHQIRIGGRIFDDDAPGTTRLVVISDIGAPVDIQSPDISGS